MGVSVENEKYALPDRPPPGDRSTRQVPVDRTADRTCPALNLRGIDWVIVGGESGPHARPMDPEWVTGIRDQCLKAAVPSSSSSGAEKKKKTRSHARRPDVG